MEKPVEKLGYGEALDELEQILTSLEATSVDVDLLSAQVRRGNELLEHCKKRLALVGDQVAETVSTIETSATEDD